MRTLTPLLLVLFSYTATSQTYQERFEALFYSDTTLEVVLPILKAWEAAKPKDAEMFVSAANYYLMASQEEIMNLSPTPPETGEEALEIRDSTGEIQGYMYKMIVRNDSVAAIGIEYLDRGIAAHPLRLDMHFGRCYMLRELKMYDQHIDTFKKLFELDEENGDKWLWTGDVPMDEVEVDFKTSMHEYAIAIASSNIPMEQTVDALKTAIDYYSDEPMFYNDLGVAYFYDGNLEMAQEYFQEAYELDTSDMVALNNVAYVYYLNKDFDAARELYEILAESDNPDDVAIAQEQLRLIDNEE